MERKDILYIFEIFQEELNKRDTDIEVPFVLKVHTLKLCYQKKKN